MGGFQELQEVGDVRFHINPVSTNPNFNMDNIMKKLLILIYSCLVLLMAWTAFGYPPVPPTIWIGDLASSTETFTGTETKKAVTPAGLAAAGGLRDFSSIAMTNGDTQTAFSEANMKANKYLTNQGETVELDVILVAVSYPIGGVISNEEALVTEICPPSGEIIYLDGVALDANDCVDSDGAVRSLASYFRFQDASAAWHYHILSITGAWTDTGATD